MGVGASRGEDEKALEWFVASSTRCIARSSARYIPRSLRFLRFVCDNAVPTCVLPANVWRKQETLTLLGIPPLLVEWVLPKGSEIPRQGAVILYVHGGAYVLCNAGSHRGITYSLCDNLSIPVCVPVYRRPPENPVPAMFEDVLAMYLHLSEMLGREADIKMVGDSAGGGIIAALLVQLRGSTLPQPKCVACVSPWIDLNEKLEPSFHVDFVLPDLAKYFAEIVGTNDLRVSPLYDEGEKKDFPPIFVVYGEYENLRPQIEQFLSLWSSHGACMSGHVVPNGMHVPILLSFCHAPARTAYFRLFEFIRSAGAEVGRPGDDVGDSRRITL